MDIKDSYLHGTVGVVKSIGVDGDNIKYTLADVANTTELIPLPVVTTEYNGMVPRITDTTTRANYDYKTLTVDLSGKLNWRLFPTTYRTYNTLEGIPDNGNTQAWYNILTITDNTNSPCIFIIKAYAHSSAIFAVSKGHATSGNITLLNYAQNPNSSYAYIKGARLLSNGVVLVLLNIPKENSKQYVQINAAVYNATGAKPDSTLVLYDSLPSDVTVADTKEFITNSMMSNKFVGNLTGDVTGTATNSTNSTNTTNVNIATLSVNDNFPLLFTTNVTAGNKRIYTDSTNELKYNPSTGVLSSTYILAKGFVGIANSLTDLMKSGNFLTYRRFDKSTFTDETGITVSGNGNGVIWVGTHKPEASNTSEIGYGHMLGFVGGNGALYHKIVTNGDTTKAWKQIAYTSSDITGNAASADKLKTSRKLWGLDFDGSADVSGSLTGVTSINMNGDIIINDGTNHDRYIKWLYNNTDDFGWRIGYLGSASANNDLTFDSHKKTEGWASALYFKHTTLNAHFAGIVNAPTFQGNLDGSYINALTGYSKATAIDSIAATDSLNTALGKLEYKADWACDWITSVTADDTDTLVNKWGEIVDFLDSVAEGTDITKEFVTMKTTQTITGLKTFLADGTIFTNGTYGARLLGHGNRGHLQFGQISGENRVHLGKISGFNGVTLTSLDISSTSSSFSGMVTATKLITKDGTSSQFVKGDGSLDSNTYAKSTDIPTLLKNPNDIKFKNTDGTVVSYDGSTAVDLTGGVKYATDATNLLIYKGLSSSVYTTVKAMKDQLKVEFENVELCVGSAINIPYQTIPNWNDESFAYNSGGTYTAIKLSGGYSGNDYGLWLLSAFGDLRLYYVGLSGGEWTPLRKIAITNDIPTKTSQLTNDSGFLTLHQSLVNYVTLNTALDITGLKTFKAASTKENLIGVALKLGNSGWLGNMQTALDFYNGLYTVPNARISTLMNGGGEAGGTLIFSTQTKHESDNPNPNGLTERFRISDTGTATFSCNVETTRGITLQTASGDSPALIFQRGRLGTDSSVDWRMYVSDGKFLLQRISGTTDAPGAWTNVLNFNTGSNNDNKILTSSYSITAPSFKGNLTGNVTGNVSGSSGSCTGNAATATTLKPTTIVSAKSFSLVNTTWTDTDYTFESLATGTYVVQVTSGTNLVASGIMSVCKNLNDTIGDEIPLHVQSTAGWRPYLRTYQNKLWISANISPDAKDDDKKKSVTIKIAQIL